MNCHFCGSQKIEKTLMAPNVLNSSDIRSKDVNKIKEIKSKLREFKKFIKDNFKYVGDNFAHEADQWYDPKRKIKQFGKAYKKKYKISNKKVLKQRSFRIEDKEN